MLLPLVLLLALPLVLPLALPLALPLVLLPGAGLGKWHRLGDDADESRLMS